MKIPAVIKFDLNEDVIKELAPLFDFAETEEKPGRPGMIIAQAFRPYDGAPYVQFGYVEHDLAKRISYLMDIAAADGMVSIIGEKK